MSGASLDAHLVVGPDRHGRTVLIGADGLVEAGPAPQGAATLPCPEGAIAPGRVNAHTHLYSGLAPFGMPAPEPPPGCFVEILERLWWRLDRALDAPALRASARWYVAEALRCGTTGLIDHHESPAFLEGSLDVLADACEELGIRCVLGYGATERNGGRDEGRAGLGECARLIRAGRGPLVRGVVALHASFTVSDETCREAGALCRELDTVLHVHLAEDGADVEDARARGYHGPLERLEALDALPAGSLLAHGVHLGPDQIRRAADQGCWLVQNPRSNEGNRVGYPSALRHTARVGLGTDGYPADMEAEAAALARLGSEHGDAPEVLDRRPTTSRAILGAMFGASADLWTPGALGDLVVRDAAGVRDVVVGGRVVLRDRRLVGADHEAVRADAEREAQRLWTRMRGLP